MTTSSATLRLRTLPRPRTRVDRIRAATGIRRLLRRTRQLHPRRRHAKLHAHPRRHAKLHAHPRRHAVHAQRHARAPAADQLHRHARRCRCRRNTRILLRRKTTRRRTRRDRRDTRTIVVERRAWKRARFFAHSARRGSRWSGARLRARGSALLKGHVEGGAAGALLPLEE